MTVVLDTSAAVELLLKRPRATEINNIIEDCDKIITSELYKAEITNVFYKYEKASLLEKNIAVTLMEYAFEIIDEYFEIASFSIEAFNEALRLQHSSYDMLFLTLAKRTGGVLLTLDTKLAQLSKSQGIDLPLQV